MELHAEDGTFPYRGRKGLAVRACSLDNTLFAWLQKVAMHEIEYVRSNAPEEPRIFLWHNVVPADMRDTEFFRIRPEFADCPFDERKPFMVPAFFPRFCKKLHAEAYSEEWFLFFEHLLLQHREETEPTEIIHAVLECPHTRQDDMACSLEVLRFPRKYRRD